MDYVFPRDRVKPSKWLIETYWRQFERDHGRQPTKRELKEAFGLTRSQARYYMGLMEND